MVKWIQRLKQYFSKNVDYAQKLADQKEAADVPWACFEISDFEADGRIKVKFNWNPQFIAKIKQLGFQAETDEDTVQLFFYTSSMRPTQLANDPQDDPIQSSAHPSLSSIQNEIRV